MGELEAGEQVRVLPCASRHAFHAECIFEWLTKSSVCCPADREDMRPFFRPSDEMVGCLIA